MKQIKLKVNGQDRTVHVDPDSPLLFVLSDELGLRGPRFGCGMAQCGFCLTGVILAAKSVLDGKPDASDEEIRIALDGVLCCCFIHTRNAARHPEIRRCEQGTCSQGVTF